MTAAKRGFRFAEVAKVAKPIFTGPIGSGYVMEYRANAADLRKKKNGCEECVLQATWIYKLGCQNLGNFDCHLGRELVP